MLNIKESLIKQVIDHWRCRRQLKQRLLQELAFVTPAVAAFYRFLQNDDNDHDDNEIDAEVPNSELFLRAVEKVMTLKNCATMSDFSEKFFTFVSSLTSLELTPSLFHWLMRTIRQAQAQVKTFLHMCMPTSFLLLVECDLHIDRTFMINQHDQREWYNLLNESFEVCSYRVYYQAEQRWVVRPTPVIFNDQKKVSFGEKQSVERKWRNSGCVQSPFVVMPNCSETFMDHFEADPDEEEDLAFLQSHYLNSTKGGPLFRLGLCSEIPFALKEPYTAPIDIQTPSKPSLSAVTEPSTQLMTVFVDVPSDTSKRVVMALRGRFHRHSLYGFCGQFPVAAMAARMQRLRERVETTVDINTPFGQQWLETISLPDFLAKEEDVLVNECIQLHLFAESLKKMQISKLISDFIVSTEIHMKKVLMALFLNGPESDLTFIGFLMIDLIRSEEKYTRNKKVLNDVIATLPLLIRHNIAEYTSSDVLIQSRRKSIGINLIPTIIQDLDGDHFLLDKDDVGGGGGGQEEEFLSYEQRIHLMRTSVIAKRKAYEKLKEVESKSGSDNQVKAQQYLDSLLKIPFGLFREESMFAFVKRFVSMFLTTLRSTDNTECCPTELKNVLLSGKTDISYTVLDRLFSTEGVSTPFSPVVPLNPLLSLPPNPNPGVVVSLEHVLSVLQNGGENISFDVLERLVDDMKSCLDRVRLFFRNPEDGKKRMLTTTAPSSSSSARRGEALAKSIELFLRQAPAEAIERLQPLFQASILFAPKQTKSTAFSTPKNEAWTKLSNEWKAFAERRHSFMISTRDLLDESIYAQEEAKRSIEQIIAQWISGQHKGECIGFEGPPGTGKTTLAKHGIARCLCDDKGQTRPIQFIALGGSCNGSTLEGHSYTYMGATYGKIVQCLIDSQCMNPIIFIDELDKVSTTEQGREIIGILTHMTDPSQNTTFTDKYFSGISLDLSHVLFIFSYNDIHKIDPILRDRIQSVSFHPLVKQEKVHVSRNHLLPDIFATTGLSETDIVFPEDVLLFIIDNYTCEVGARRLKEQLTFIVRELNLRNLKEPKTLFPITLTIPMLQNDLFTEKLVRPPRGIDSIPTVGRINGLFATDYGFGGLTVIECRPMVSNTSLALELTGNLGEIMRESVKVARTVAYDLLKPTFLQQLRESSKWPTGLHLHALETSMKKEGPSAGCAIALCILSCLTDVPIDNTMAMTGEIDLQGNSSAIGGLLQKIDGAKEAGVKKVFFPAENSIDIEKYRRSARKQCDLLTEVSLIPFQNIRDIVVEVMGEAILSYLV